MTFGQTAPAGRHRQRDDECPDCRARVLVALDGAGDEVHLDAAPDPSGDHLVSPPLAEGGTPTAVRLQPRQADGARAAGHGLHLAHAVGCPYAGRVARNRPGAQRAARARR